jgi:hypothetical protein
LKNLELWRTPITVNGLRSISRLSRLEGLTLDGTGLKGDWLSHIYPLRELHRLTVINGDLSDGATDSLARMKGLTWLQLPHARIDSKLEPVLARLGKLECLVLDGTPFDDEGMKRLAALQHLKILFLGRTAITDAGLRSLERLPNLWRLSLSGNKVGDAGLRHLSQLPRLAGLDITATLATNSCLRGLAAISSLRATLVGQTRICASSEGFVGVMRDGVWFADEAKAKAADEYSKGIEAK